MFIDVVEVQPQPGHQLLLQYENGELRRFDVTPFLALKPWQCLGPAHLFERVFVENGTVAWPGNIDMAPETLYDLSNPVR